ncbi:hypothetical protein COCON_G00053960 [Conger conger]|uniref:ZP-C domain-containing protein n=1 Tax=Conger conger TaxID=82655 RepID=A0A9Q1DW55_CONCO|nr:hypothetical protein COCON_G00053960 [Conger conger]
MYSGVLPSADLHLHGNLIIRGARTELPIECHSRWQRRSRGDRAPHLEIRHLLGRRGRSVMKDWSGPRNATVFQQGEPVSLEAAVDGQSHLPLRVYVDRCVTTLSSDPLSEPSYDIIANHGLVHPTSSFHLCGSLALTAAGHSWRSVDGDGAACPGTAPAGRQSSPTLHQERPHHQTPVWVHSKRCHALIGRASCQSVISNPCAQ